MGACCSTAAEDGGLGKFVGIVDDAVYDDEEEEDLAEDQGSGARIRLKGCSDVVSMFTQQGKKGVNQDAMTVWEDFTGEKDMFFCGVFDGHGPVGHRVARRVRDKLPAKLSSVIKSATRRNGGTENDAGLADEADSHKRDVDGSGKMADSNKQEKGDDILLSSWEASYIRSFKEIDQDLGTDQSIDTFCSGTTAVTIVKKGHHLVIANLGDSRAVLCKRGQKNQLVPIQLTVDLKPNVASEAERIRRCRGRVFAMDEEPDVFRVWMPDENCPGLAMARAFGDFCLKEYGLISVPEISYRMVTPEDEFVVLATDGVWDALSNEQVVNIVASAKKRSLAAKLLVAHATLAWKTRFPGCKLDDCAVICLFLKDPPETKATTSNPSPKGKNVEAHSKKSKKAKKGEAAACSEEWNALEGVNRANSLLNVPRVSPALSPALSRHRMTEELEDIKVEVH